MGTRDIYRRPFSWDSIWNLPLASTAQLQPVEARVGDVYPDVENISVDPTAPVKHLSGDASGGGGVHVDPRLSADGSWNNCSTLLADTPDQTTVVQGQPMKLSPGGDPSWEVGWKPESLAGPGIAGCHGGSGLSGIGGTIRHGELPGAQPIRHALKVSLPCETSCSAQNGGHRWPAATADSGFEANYHGTDPRMQMGSLLAIPPTADLSALTDPDVHKVAVALQNYGAYVVDSSGGPPAGSLDVEAGAVGEFPHISSGQMKRVFGQLAVVTNNSAATPGGGALDAARRAPCAEPFTDGSGAAPATCGRGSTGSDAHLASGRPTPTPAAPLPRSSPGTSNNAPPTATGTGTLSPSTTGTSSAGTSSAAGGATTTPPAQGGDGLGATWAMSGGLAGFESAPWNSEGAADPAATASPNLPGRRAVKFIVPGGGKRTEAQPSQDRIRGIYRDPSEGQASTLYLNDLKIGDSLASVSNLAGQSVAAGSGAPAPAAGAVMVLAPLLQLELQRRRRRPDVLVPRPRPALEPRRAGDGRAPTIGRQRRDLTPDRASEAASGPERAHDNQGADVTELDAHGSATTPPSDPPPDRDRRRQGPAGESPGCLTAQVAGRGTSSAWPRRLSASWPRTRCSCPTTHRRDRRNGPHQCRNGCGPRHPRCPPAATSPPTTSSPARGLPPFTCLFSRGR